jgi:DNA polymerase-3 subunit epsilon
MKSLNNYQELIVFDCETTGFDSRMNHIIELGCSKYSLQGNEYVLTEEQNDLVRINYLLPYQIVQLTGITDLVLSQKGKEEEVVTDIFYNKFVKPNGMKKLFIAYNAPFDIGFIKEMLKRHNLSFPNESDFLDVLTMFKDRAPYPHKLENAINFYKLNQQVINSHRAIDDALATFEILKAMTRDFDDAIKYVNLFGYNPKYPPKKKADNILYKAQYYNSKNRLYE